MASVQMTPSTRGLRIAGKGWEGAVLRASLWGPAGHIEQEGYGSPGVRARCLTFQRGGGQEGMRGGDTVYDGDLQIAIRL